MTLELGGCCKQSEGFMTKICTLNLVFLFIFVVFEKSMLKMAWFSFNFFLKTSALNADDKCCVMSFEVPLIHFD